MQCGVINLASEPSLTLLDGLWSMSSKGRRARMFVIEAIVTMEYLCIVRDSSCLSYHGNGVSLHC